MTHDQGGGVGTVERPGIATGAAAARHGEYAELTRRIRAAGLLSAQPRYYLVKCVIGFVCMAAVLWGFWAFRSIGAQMALALVFAVCCGQLAFLFHEIPIDNDLYRSMMGCPCRGVSVPSFASYSMLYRCREGIFATLPIFFVIPISPDPVFFAARHCRGTAMRLGPFCFEHSPLIRGSGCGLYD